MKVFWFRLRDNYIFSFALLLISILILKGYPVANGIDFLELYMISPLKQWDPNYLLNDWTFSSPDYGHMVFNKIVAPFNAFFSIRTLSWVGRVLSWSMVIIGLLRLGRHFRIPTWMATFSIFLWFVYGQSIVGGEFIIGVFSAKSIAYVFLLFAIEGFLRQKDLSSSIFLGLSFSFHPAVGVWAGLGIGLTVIALRYPIMKLVKIGFFTVL